MHKPLSSITKTLNVSFDQAKSLLFDIRPGSFTREHAPLLLLGFAPLTIQQNEDKFTILYRQDSKIFVCLDKRNNAVSIDGEWWYRGYYKLEQTESGAQLTYEVHNIAPNLRWLIPLFMWNKKTRASSKENFNTLVQLINLRKDNRF
jgi:hypothetical protein